MNTKAQEILYQATEKLMQLTGITINTLKMQANITDNGYDAELEIKTNNKLVRFAVDIKNELRDRKYIPYQKDKDFLLVAQYIPKPLKLELKNANYNYLDAAGNCFIQTPEIFIYINDQQVTETRIPAEGKLWKTAGLKFLYGILIHPELLNFPYRTIAQEVGIALGNVGGLIEELKKEGYLLDGGKNKGLFIGNKERLITRWAEAFGTTLRPKLLMGTFRFMDKNAAKNWEKLDTTLFRWGGENAGALLTGFLQPQKFTIYTKEPKTALMKKLQLVPDPNGNVEMLQLIEVNNETAIMDIVKTVPPLLAYAELITSFDSRNQETAERIKIKYID